MLHQNALQAARIAELEEQLAVIIKRKTCKRKRIQQGGTIEVDKHEVFIALSPTRWSNDAVGFAWLTQVFERYTKEKAGSK
jgi:hypothetical protein